ncbi:hypothetical protein SAMN05421874_12888 [Nonomuraea maritima]|uniref:Uncharacterized protein n=1 Tax=Nonomuraea maritima TaxID=683260 RepID=A0A1G9MLM7_9ACTN|nr:hypothetical protein [Nonomuraea maritima]SDL75034.1 hypothetical protein SAMN05421874_12888 [Nonomuraea maritima]
MTRIAAIAMSIVFIVALIEHALKGTAPAMLVALAALAMVSVTATAALGRPRRLAGLAYRRGYQDASRTP